MDEVHGLYEALKKQFEVVCVRYLRIAPLSAAVLILLGGTILLAIIYCIMLFCCRARKRMSTNGEKRDSHRKGLFSLMFARLEEFDSLTPLIVTPATSTSSSITVPPEKNNQSSPHRLISLTDRTSSSPPLPRRPISTKTLIVPLNASRYRSPVVPLLGTPDSRVTSFETGTTKSCATIPEDDEEGEIIDLVSIDRTSYSCSTEVKSGSRNFITNSSYNLQIPQPPPAFQIGVPTYTPPEPPLTRPSRLKTKEDKQKQKRSPDSSSSYSLGSPASSIGSASPLETSGGSISDTFYVIHETIDRNPDRLADSDSQSKYQLHRIEEESEHLGDDSAMAYSRTDGSIALGHLTDACRPIPRSISEQFELMHQKKAS